MHPLALTAVAAAALATLPRVLDQPLSAGAWLVALALAVAGPLVARPALTRVAAPVAGVLWLQVLVFPLPSSVWAFGLVLGLMAALVALGMALVYRANRVFNFAQAEMGVAPVVLVVGLINFSSWPWLLAVPVGLVAALVLGLVVNVVVIRRFRTAPRLVLTVATIGLSQLLAFVSLMLPRLWGQNLVDQDIDVPWDVVLSEGPPRLEGDHVLALVVVPLVVAALAAFFRFTDVGMAVRAASERADRAALLGIPVRRLQAVVWCLAVGLSFVGVLLRAGVVGLPVAATLSFGALLAALAALVLGNLTDMVAVGASAVAIGVLEQGVIHNHPDQLVAPVLGGVIVVTMLVRRLGTSRLAADATSSWRTSEEVRPIPPELRQRPEVRGAKALGGALVLAALVAFPFVARPSQQLEAATVACFVLVVASVVVLTGWAGQISLGQMSFAAVGAVVGAQATGDWDLDLSLALLLAGTAGAAVAVLVGLPALRLRGPLLAVTTLAFAVASSQYLLNRSQVSWLPRGRLARPRLLAVIDLSSQRTMFWTCAAVAVLGLLAVRGVRASRTGRVLLALRDNEAAARSYSVEVVRAKLSAFALSGFLAAVAGCLLAHVTMGYTEQPFSPTASFNVFTAAVVGGLGSLTGAVLGALFLNGGRWVLTGDWQLLPSAVGVLFVLLLLPGGLGDVLYRVRDAALRRLAARRGLVVPSLAGTSSPPSVQGDEGGGEAGGPAPEPEPPTGGEPLLAVRDLDVRYGEVRILFGVDLDVHPGEVVALLGTNGAGKSTLLDAISGLVPVRGGSVTFAGRAITGASPEDIAAAGISQVPGGKGTFPGLTVAENLRVATWMARGGGAAEVEARLARVHEMFPVLAERSEDAAADLSGGQQQMLALSMAFLTRPRLLAIDELSLGLAPVVVEQLLEAVRALRDEGTTVVVVEQSVTVALALADRAYFLEKGQVRYHGPTAELLDRPDVLRSVFLEGATRGLAAAGVTPAGAEEDDGDGTGEAGADGPVDGPVDEDHVLRVAVAASASTLPPAAGNGPDEDRDGPALEARGLSVRFGGVVATDDVSLTVAPGEVLGIIGPNGAGKTTLFDLLSGLTPAAEGRVLIGGRDITRSAASARAGAGLGRSFQDSRLFPSLTVAEAIAVARERWVAVRDPLNAALRLPALVDSEAQVAADVEALVELLGLAVFRNSFVGELSTGTRRIVDLACVLAHRPTVVLLDEPSSGIAQREAEALGPLLLRIRTVLGASLVVIEHDMALIRSVSDRLLALDQGRVVTTGSPAEVLAHPEVVASYLGSGVAVTRSGAAARVGAP